ncbi:MAG: hypothetical protein ACE5OW_02425 [Candidatus Bathyarchaeia archaeon]
MARERTGPYYAFLILFIIVAFIIVIWRSWIGGGTWWELLGGIQPGSRPAQALPFEAQVVLMIVVIVAGIIIAALWHRHATAR